MKKVLVFLSICACLSAVSHAKVVTTAQKNNVSLAFSDKTTALDNANYILSNPYDAQNSKRSAAIQALIKWMTDTPDFSFSIEPVVMEKIVGDDEGLLGIYMACMAKYCMENEANSKDFDLVRLNAVKLMIAYSEKPENNIKMSKSFKKIAQADKKGELQKVLSQE